jgi:hypothetical protein
MEEPSKEEYERIRKDCQKLLIQEGGKASLIYGTLSLAAIVGFARLTKFGQRVSFHPYALLATTGYVAPFWVVGEQSVLFCQRSAFDKRKAIVGDRFEKERFNKE